VLLQPRPDPGPERGLLGGVVEVHAAAILIRRLIDERDERRGRAPTSGARAGSNDVVVLRP
jgi:hypothetical protein